ncbi:unnamed protein product [Scytosiphon promiscuus]
MRTKGSPLSTVVRRGRSSFLLRLLCGTWIATTATSSKNALLEDKGPPPPNLPFEPLTSPPQCLACTDIFSLLEDGQDGRGLTQRVEMVERGAPKTGTGGMFEDAVNLLFHTCRYLNQHYGRDTCFVDWGRWGPGDYYGNHTLVFEPPREQPSDAPCSCTGVSRVTISLSKLGKHTLPVEDTCPYAHGAGYHLHLKFCETEDSHGEGGRGVTPSAATYTTTLAANAADGGADAETSPFQFDRIWGCMEEARCRVVDDRKQMVVLRDPREAAVSSFYFLRAGRFIPENADIDAFVVQTFPTFCKWHGIRLALFTRMMPRENVSFFWYHKWRAHPLKWHQEVLRAVGLGGLPDSVAVDACDAALADDFPFFSKGRDSHGQVVVPSGEHSYRDDIAEETSRTIDSMLREWLPSELLEELRLHSG